MVTSVCSIVVSMNILLALVALTIIFYVLAILTEYFFVPAIDVITRRLNISSDAAGATFLAMGSSAAEFFTSLIAILTLVNKGGANVGAGTIVGSAIFNILVIVGASAMYKTVTLQWKPVLRDQIFYILTILLLLAAFWDGKIVLYEAIGFVFTYVFYVYVVIQWRKWFKYEEPELPDNADLEKKTRLSGLAHRLISCVVPDPVRRPKLYIITFIFSIIAIAGLSWVMIDQVLVIADALNINATFLALTVLAAGTSIPDLLGSLVVAKQGRGDMAVSNAVGSNIFDILFALGFPWLIVLLFKTDEIIVSTENLSASIFLLFATVVATLFLLIARKWRLGRYSGIFLIGLYVAYCVYLVITII